MAGIPASPGCPACLKRSTSILGYQDAYLWHICRGCRTLFVDRPPTQEGQDYDDYYSEGNLSVPDFVNDRLEQVIETFSTLRFRQTGRLLDVGFGAGASLACRTSQGVGVLGDGDIGQCARVRS